MDYYWQYNVNCAQNGTPELTCNYGPNINRPFEFFLRGAPKNRMALLATGLQGLNLDLGPAGAPGCMLLVAPLLLTSAPTDAQGFLLVRSGVPNMKGLLNASFRLQFAIHDTTNPLGLVFSNGLIATIGNSPI